MVCWHKGHKIKKTLNDSLRILQLGGSSVCRWVPRHGCTSSSHRTTCSCLIVSSQQFSAFSPHTMYVIHVGLWTIIIQLHWDLPVDLGHLLCQVDWRLDDFHHARSLHWGKLLEEFASSLSVVYLLVNFLSQYVIEMLSLSKPSVLLGGSPCYPPPCSIKAERGVNQQERRWRLKKSTWTQKCSAGKYWCISEVYTRW